jgi:hypothetical protein
MSLRRPLAFEESGFIFETFLPTPRKKNKTGKERKLASGASTINLFLLPQI